jgi:hypothetical protein
LVLSYQARDTDFDVSVLSMEGERSLRTLLDSPAAEFSPSISPTGTWIAYVSDETGQNEIHVDHFPDLRGKQTISTGGGRDPVWSLDGSELFYRDLRGIRMMVVPFDIDTAVVGEARVAFELPESTGLSEGNYSRPEAGNQAGGTPFDLAPDGQRFLMVRRGAASAVDASAPPEIILVQNWSAVLQRLVPTP